MKWVIVGLIWAFWLPILLTLVRAWLALRQLTAAFRTFTSHLNALGLGKPLLRKPDLSGFQIPVRDDGAWLEQGCWREDATCPACQLARELADAHPRLTAVHVFAIVDRRIAEGRCEDHVERRRTV